MSHSKAHLEQMKEAERWDLEWTSTCTSEEKMDLMIDTKTGRHGIPFAEILNILGFLFDAKCKQGLVERRGDVQKQRRAVGSDVHKDDGTFS